MNEPTIETFSHEGKDYEIRIFNSGVDWTIKSFCEGKDARVGATLSLETSWQMKTYAFGTSAIDELTKAVKEELIRRAGV